MGGEGGNGFRAIFVLLMFEFMFYILYIILMYVSRLEAADDCERVSY